MATLAQLHTRQSVPRTASTGATWSKHVVKSRAQLAGEGQVAAWQCSAHAPLCLTWICCCLPTMRSKPVDML